MSVDSLEVRTAEDLEGDPEGDPQYEFMSIEHVDTFSTNCTESNLVGTGRSLDYLFGVLGRKVEQCLNMALEKAGRGLHTAEEKIMRRSEKGSTPRRGQRGLKSLIDFYKCLIRRHRIEGDCRRLLKYLKWVKMFRCKSLLIVWSKIKRRKDARQGSSSSFQHL